MLVRPYGLRACAAMLFSAVLLVAGLGCHKSQSGVASGTFQISGTVTYTRKPLSYDANGVPLGVSTNPSAYLASSAARGMALRVFQLRPQDNPDFTTTYVWAQVASATTDLNGFYQVSANILQNWPTFIELTSLMTQPGTPSSTVSVIADPAGVYSTLNITDRPIYVMRQNLDATAVTSPTTVQVGYNDVVVNFSLGLTDTWTVAAPKWWIPATATFPAAATVNAGSSIPAILDACWYFSYEYSNAVPSPTASALDFHYVPGLSVKRGTFVEYNPLAFPLAFDGSGFHYFGAISGGGTVDGVVQPDDAFDVGAIYPLLGRNMIFGQRKTNLIPTGQPATNLAPDLALVEGLGDGMATTILQSPYLAGTPTLIPGSNPPTNTRYGPARDVRDLSALAKAQQGVFSAPTIAALTWQMALANAGVTAPGTQAQWVANINPVNLLRFYTLLTPSTTTGNETVLSDCSNLYVQLGRLEEAQSAADNSNLAATFTDSVLFNLLGPFNIPWTTQADADLPKYTTSWGIDPNTLLTPFPSFTLSMGLAQQIPSYHLDAQGKEQVTYYYPNNSHGEVVYALFANSADAGYNLKVSTIPTLPAGASIEVVLDGDVQNAYLFPASTTPKVVPLALKGNPNDLTTPVFHSVRVRMLSPSLLVPDTQVTIHLEKSN